MKKVEDEIGVLKNGIDNLRASTINTLEYATLTKISGSLNKAISDLESGTVETKEKIQQEIQNLQNRLDESKEQGKKEQYEFRMQRIRELKSRRKIGKRPLKSSNHRNVF